MQASIRRRGRPICAVANILQALWDGIFGRGSLLSALTLCLQGDADERVQLALIGLKENSPW